MQDDDATLVTGDDRNRESDALATLASLLMGAPAVGEFLDRLARSAAASWSTFAGCGITARPDGRTLTVASSGRLAMAADEVQYGEGDGPCLQALATGEEVSVPDYAREERWPAFCDYARTHGVRSSLSLPLTGEETVLGAINFYSDQPEAFTDAEAYTRAVAFTAQGSAVLAVVLHQAEQVALTGQLREALRSRSVIDQAIGVVMAQKRCGPDDAFAVLRTASQNRNQKLRTLASELLAGVGGGAARPSPFDEH